VGLALGVRAPHLDWGFPEIHEEATPVREAVQFWGNPGSSLDLNPHFFKYPTFTFYIHFTAQSVWYLWLSLTNEVQSLNGFRQLLAAELPRAVLLGRWLQVLLGSLAVIPVIRLGTLLGGRIAGWCAGTLLAVLPIAVVESRLVSPDVVLMLCTALGLVAATRVAESGKRSDYLWCGVWIGLGAAAKFPGALLVAALLTAHLLQVRGRGEGPAGVLASGLFWPALAVAGLLFAAASPYVLLDPSTALADIAFERRHMALGHFGREEGQALSYYLLDVFPRGWTPVVLVASVIGVGGLLAEKRTRARTLPGVAFAAVSLLILGSWKMGAPRYVLPLAPLAAAWTGGTAALLGRRFRSPRVRGAVTVGAGVLLLAWPLVATLGGVSREGRADSRLAAGEWIREHVPDGSAVLVERYGPEPESGRLLVLTMPFHGVDPHVYDLAYIPELYSTFDYIVLSSRVSGRYLARPREYPVEAAFYAVIDAHYAEVAAFPSGVYVGPDIRILQRREDRPVPDPSTVPESLFRDQAGNTALAEHLSALGTILVRQGRTETGFSLMQTAVDLAPTVKTWGNLGSMFLAGGRLEDALIALRRARDLSPEDAAAWFNLGTLYSRMGEQRQAAEAFEQAVRLRPEMEEAYIGLARALIEDNRLAAARAVLRGFLDRFPRSSRRPAAEEALATLRQMGPGRP
jgi:Flp pilus assembly protein TadD